MVLGLEFHLQPLKRSNPCVWMGFWPTTKTFVPLLSLFIQGYSYKTIIICLEAFSSLGGPIALKINLSPLRPDTSSWAGATKCRKDGPHSAACGMCGPGDMPADFSVCSAHLV